MSRSSIRAALALGAVAAAVALPALPAQADVCSLTATVTAAADVESADVGWEVTATGCVSTPAVGFEVRDEATPSDPSGIVVDSLGLSGSDLVPGLIGGHTYDVTLTATADAASAQDVAVVVPLAAPVGVRADTVTLKSTSEELSFGDKATLSGVAKAIGGELATDRKVTIERKANGDWRKEGSVRTDASGRYSLKVNPSANTKYRALVDNATSETLGIQVDFVVKAKFSDSKVSRSSKAVLKGSVKPDANGTKVLLQVNKHGDWKTEDSSKTSKGEVTFKFNVKATAKYRLLASATNDFGAGSDTAKLKVTQH